MTTKVGTHSERPGMEPFPERLAQLNAIAITQMRSLVGMSAVKRLGASNTSKKIEP